MKCTWETLQTECLICKKCSLCTTRNQVVFGTGNPKSEVLFVGEAPGQKEDEQGQPFVGRSGKLLDAYLNSIGLSRENNIFISNIVKCRPPQNRDPVSTERKACLPWLQAQIKLMHPKIIVCLGRISAQIMINSKIIITKEHGQWTVDNGIHFMATLHPAALLRNPNQKPMADEDFAVLRKKIDEICTYT